MLLLFQCLLICAFATSGVVSEKGMLELVTKYFTYKRIYVVSAFTCSKYDAWMFSKILALNGLSWRVLEMENKQALFQWLEKALRPEHHQQGIFLDYDCENGRQLLEKVSFYNGSYSWLIWSRNFSPEKALIPVSLSLDTEMTWATPSNNSVILTDVYKINSTLSSVVTSPAGIWNHDTYRLHYHLTAFKYTRRANLKGLQFNAAVVVTNGATEHLEEKLGSRENQHVDPSTRHNFCLYKELQLMYNFTVRLHASKSEGYPSSSGRFDGIMGMLQRSEVDLGISSVIPRPSSLQFVDLTGPTWQFRSAMLFRHPLISDPYTLLKPFTRRVWLCAILSWMLTTIIISAINLMQMKLMHEEVDRSWGTSILVVLCAVSEQGSEMESKFLSWRVAYLVTLIQVVLLNSYYGACMVSNLLQPPAPTVKTVQDFTNSKFEAGYIKNRVNEDLFASLLEPVVKELYEKKLKKHPVNSLDLALQKLRYENLGIYDEAISLYPDIERDFSNDEKCSLVEIQLFPSIMTYSVIRKGSPYREMFVYGFLKLMESGVLKRELLYWRPPAPRCQYMDRPRSINMKHVSVAFFIFLVGALLAVAVFFCERLLFLGSIHFCTNFRYWRNKRA